MWHKLGSWLQEIRSADLRWVLCAVVVYWLGAVAVAMRFRQFLRGLHCNVTLKETLLANLAFTFVNNVTPGRVGGELLRIAILRRRTQVDWPRATAASLYDRLFDLTGVPLVVVVALPALPHLLVRLSELFRAWHVAWLTPVLLVCGVLLAIRLLFLAAPKLQDRLRQIVGHLTPWRVSRRTLLTGMGWAWTVWILDATRLALAALAFRSMLGITQAAALSLAYNIGAAVPVMGGLGAVESSLTAVLCLFGVSLQAAIAITVLERIISYVQGTVAGGIALLFLGGQKLLRSAKNDQPTQAPAPKS